jgi:hypothetical protein
MEHAALMPRWPDMRAICLILVLAASACASAPPLPQDSDTASSCGGAGLVVTPCGQEVEIEHSES